jgi:hypothetical protein
MTEIDEIKERNRRVELDKAWETSVTRRVAIMTLTYLVASFWLLETRNHFLMRLYQSEGIYFQHSPFRSSSSGGLRITIMTENAQGPIYELIVGARIATYGS